jgi:hypothetical protein
MFSVKPRGTAMTTETVLNVLVQDNYGREYFDSGHVRYTHTVWDAEKGCPTFCNTFEGRHTFVPATPEMFAAWEAWKIAEAKRIAAGTRKNEIMKRWTRRAELRKTADTINTSYTLLVTLEKKVGAEKLDLLTQLVKSFLSNRLKSSFKESLALQVVEWLNEPALQEKYKTPLSPKQMGFLVPVSRGYGYGRRY